MTKDGRDRLVDAVHIITTEISAYANELEQRKPLLDDLYSCRKLLLAFIGDFDIWYEQRYDIKNSK